MWLYLVRHGIAQPRRGGLNDSDRALTVQGIDKTRRAMQGLARLIRDEPDRAPQVILTSPKARAHQTAKLAAEVLQIKVEVVADLANAPAVKLAKRLLMFCRQTNGLAVGHEPTLTQAMAFLMTGHLIPDLVKLKKSSVACLEIPPAASRSSDESDLAKMHWLATPRMLRRLVR